MTAFLSPLNFVDHILQYVEMTICMFSSTLSFVLSSFFSFFVVSCRLYTVSELLQWTVQSIIVDVLKPRSVRVA